MKEKRSSPRFNIEQMIEISYSKESIIHAQGKNLSKTGLLCHTQEDVEVYAKLFLMIELFMDKERIEFQCEGIVIRSNPIGNKFEVGIKFSSLNDESQADLERFLESCS